MTMELPPSPLESAIEEVKDDLEEAIEEVKDAVDDINLDEFVDQVASAVYNKVEKLIKDLVDATQDAVAITEEASPPPEPAAEAATDEDEEQEEDVRPKHRHPMFHKPLKKDD